MSGYNEAADFGGIFEGIVSFRAVTQAISEGNNTRQIKTLYYSKEKLEKNAHEFSYIKAKSHELGFEIKITDSETLGNMTNGNSHGGIAFECSQRTLGRLTELTATENSFYVMLDGIEDPYNFGYALRSLYAAGAAGAVVPPRNWMSAAGIVCRSSAGASERIPMYICESADEITEMKKRGFSLICTDTDNSVSMYDAEYSLPLLLVIGGEKRGISKSIKSLADITVRIDYGREFGEALSAASASAVLGFEIAKRSGIIK